MGTGYDGIYYFLETAMEIGKVVIFKMLGL
jgi:hypothetical protein